MSAGIPRSVHVDGVEWVVERVWPAGEDGRTPLEAHADGAVRGGYAEGDGVALLAPEDDGALPALAGLAAEGEVVSHRPGKRAVVRLPMGRGYAKVVPPGRASRVIDAHARGASFAGAFRIPAIVPDDREQRGVVRFTAVGGRTLYDLGADPVREESQWRAAWEAWETSWTAVVDDARVDHLPAHEAEDEARVMTEWASRASERLPAGADARDELAALAGHLAAQVEKHSTDADALAHRDLHDKQLLWDGDEGIALLDLDTCVRADPGLDLGNLAAHVDLALRHGRWPRRRGRIAFASIGRAADALGVEPGRLSAWRAAAQFRVACVNLLRPRWRDRSERALEGMIRDFRTEAGPWEA
ncbi:hypothetical protein N8K70_10245 [Microbacterium betulae]|uniref:Aminoglycoside phosphotransferase domain-containing protein n=1 Tax=Microbacterium betulae TaxID=2981139 RepID=A0AA97I5P7_9MICO|nr:hypothetical protein [Microbacterium sp. AB]WOF21767.1 hypothetical protein N8K70_10245 [Microbacterium sp. AB]